MSREREEHPFEQPDRLFDYLDDRLTEKQRGEIEGHLEVCVSCRDRLREQQAVAAMLARYSLVDPPSELPDRIFAGLQENHQSSGLRSEKPRSSLSELRRKLSSLNLQPRVLIPLAAGLLVVAIGFGELRGYLQSTAGVEEAGVGVTAEADGTDSALRSAPFAADDPADDEGAGAPPYGGTEAEDSTTGETGASEGSEEAASGEDLGAEEGLEAQEGVGAQEDPLGLAGRVVHIRYRPSSESPAAGSAGLDALLQAAPEQPGNAADGGSVLFWASAEDVSLLLDRLAENGLQPDLSPGYTWELGEESAGLAQTAPLLDLTETGSVTQLVADPAPVEERLGRGEVLVLLEPLLDSR